MSFDVRIPKAMQDCIAGWELSEAVKVEIYRNLIDDLAPHGLARLRRIKVPFDGYLYRFAIKVEELVILTYVFDFRVVIRKEAELVVTEGWYVCTIGQPDPEND